MITGKMAAIYRNSRLNGFRLVRYKLTLEQIKQLCRERYSDRLEQMLWEQRCIDGEVFIFGTPIFYVRQTYEEIIIDRTTSYKPNKRGF